MNLIHKILEGGAEIALPFFEFVAACFITYKILWLAEIIDVSLHRLWDKWQRRGTTTERQSRVKGAPPKVNIS